DAVSPVLQVAPIGSTAPCGSPLNDQLPSQRLSAVTVCSPALAKDSVQSLDAFAAHGVPPAGQVIEPAAPPENAAETMPISTVTLLPPAMVSTEAVTDPSVGSSGSSQNQVGRFTRVP